MLSASSFLAITSVTSSKNQNSSTQTSFLIMPFFAISTVMNYYVISSGGVELCCVIFICAWHHWLL